MGESSDHGRRWVDDKGYHSKNFHLQYLKLSDGGTAVSYAPYVYLLHEAISDECFRMPVYDILHYHSLHSHILALLQFTLPYKVWLELLELVHQT